MNAAPLTLGRPGTKAGVHSGITTGFMNDSTDFRAAGQRFREAMSRVAEQVHVVATRGLAGLGGATATAVASVSDSPPTILVCLNNASSTLARIRANGVLSVNVLSDAQREVAEIFAGGRGLEGEARFRPQDGWSMAGLAPVLAGALSSFDCRVTDLSAVGSHVVVFGAVEAIAIGGDGPPLLYHRRRYETL